ncbi:hypothetical protein F5Y11DRAFT_322384 [Daldinia sp. FL1419]|nr:hypothetical protein F5Y11DRAFT_322384 [Daldinia sp. FL1419]
MMKAGRHLDESVCIEYIADLFDTATELVYSAGYMTGPEFWAGVSGRVRWAGRVSPADLYDLSIRIIAARRLFHNNVDFWVEKRDEEQTDDIPDSYFVRNFNAANTAVDSFTRVIVDTYGSNSPTTDIYYPMWADDSDNEGSEAATRARTEENCNRRYTINTEDRDNHEEGGGDVEMAGMDDQEVDEYEEDGEDDEYEEDGENEEYEYDEEYDEVELEGEAHEQTDEGDQSMEVSLRFR